ncbi:UNVERIFIED_CONTAM: Vascular-related unknown protein 1 [Sesamum radiatum]|uniref:Uncharacterized protein n=1 Tax=Sesamum radiatum TaxID=300843 RepID=A0AAW2K6V3_SESRA
METPKNSSLSRSVSGVRADHDGESGWTAYLEDFSCSNNGSFISSSSSPSLVSDAAWNGSDTNNKNNVVNHVRRLNFKNLKKGSNHKRYSCRDDDNDDLEDTASSPVNSPKVIVVVLMIMIMASIRFTFYEIIHVTDHERRQKFRVFIHLICINFENLMMS